MIVVKSNKITNTFKVGEITYELILMDRPKEDSSTDEVYMPTITPENPYTDDVGYVDFTLNGIPTRSGYEFIGWYLEDSETALYNSETTVIQVGYDDNGTVTDGNYVKLTLYAHWELVSDAIIYHAYIQMI